MERLEYLLSELDKVSYTGKQTCLSALNEAIYDLIYFLEAMGSKADNEKKQLQGCCWILYEGHHLKTDEQMFLTFHYLKDKVFRSCKTLLESGQRGKAAA